jgi:hypothetical protein
MEWKQEQKDTLMHSMMIHTKQAFSMEASNLP